VTQANPAIYEAAMQLVRDGTWVVDHGSGVVYARYGRPIRRLNGDGYLLGRGRKRQTADLMQGEATA
jgi:hypothetical protein